MAVCPLCVLGFSDPHSKADWDRLAWDTELQDRLETLRVASRREHNRAAHGLDSDAPCAEHIG